MWWTVMSATADTEKVSAVAAPRGLGGQVPPCCGHWGSSAHQMWTGSSVVGRFRGREPAAGSVACPLRLEGCRLATASQLPVDAAAAGYLVGG
jgi:hypothetical protein